jgi:hypothetical protein
LKPNCCRALSAHQDVVQYIFSKKKKRKRCDAIWMDFAGMKLCGLLGKAFVLHGDRCSTGWE